MRTLLCLVPVLVLALSVGASGQAPIQTDTFKTSAGDLQVSFIGHGTLMFRFGKLIVHVDPVSQYADYANLPKAGLVLVTHEHSDHLDAKAIQAIKTAATIVIGPAKCATQVPGITVMKNGDRLTLEGLTIEAVPAYNIVHTRPDGAPYHPKGEGNGYLITFGGKRVLVAGDTEAVPEITALKSIDIAFLPMNLPFTMTPEMVATAAKAMAPKVLYPYHYGNTDTAQLVALLKDTPGVEVRIRNLK